MSSASSSSSAALSIGIVLFPNVTQLGVTGPCEVFVRMPATKVHFVAATLEPIRSKPGLTFLPELTFETVPPLDVICVPGGVGVNVAVEDEALLAFLQRQASSARFVTSVCTGALVLGAAGLLQGYRATTHRLSLDLLPLFGAHPVDERIVVDRNRITARGVTAGIDFGLVIASKLCDAALASAHRLAAPQFSLQHVTCKSSATEGIAIDSLEPGTTLVVHTRNSQYRFVILLDPHVVLVKGGAMFPEPTVVRLEGATAGGSALKMGCILVGFEMEMWRGFQRIRSSRVRSISIESVPAVPTGVGRPHA